MSDEYLPLNGALGYRRGC